MSRWYPGRNKKNNIPIECSEWIKGQSLAETYAAIFGTRSVEKFRQGLRSRKPPRSSTLAPLCGEGNLFSSYCGGEIYTVTTARRCWIGHVSELTAEQQKELTAHHARTATPFAVEVRPAGDEGGGK